jgi:thymidylate kinase
MGDARTRLFADACAALDRAGVAFCVLHDTEELTESVRSDVDMITPDPWAVARALAATPGLRVVQALQHESTAVYTVAARFEAGRPVFVKLDASSDYRREGRVFYTGAQLLAGQRRVGALNAPAPAMEFGCYLVKKVAKGEIEERQAARLTALYRSDPAGARREIGRFWAGAAAEGLARAAEGGQWEDVRGNLPALKATMMARAGRGPLAAARYWLADARRRMARALCPTGLVVACLGPDGAGKSAVLARVEAELLDAFRRTHRYHFRPILGRRATGPGGPVSNPHGRPPRGWAASVAKLMYYGADYLLGYWLAVRPRKARSTLVVFDRYYCDLLVDPRRYRYGGPEWVARAVGGVVPQPDLYLFLDAPAEALVARKGEVPLAEAARLRARYVEAASRLPRARVVDAGRPLDAVVETAERAVLDCMAARTARRLGVSLPPDDAGKGE